MPFRSVVPPLAALLLLAFAPPTARADEVTPSGGRARDAAAVDADYAGTGERMTFEDAARDLTAVYPIQISDAQQVVQNSFNWNGPADASLRCDIGFTPDAVVIRGEFVDDHPFCQTSPQPAMPDWWMITYGADAIQFVFDDPTSATRRVSFVLNFGSRATRPQVDLLASPGRRPGRVAAATLELFDGRPGADEAQKAVHFRAAVPIAALGDPRFFGGALRISVRMHDLDGDWSTYQVLQEVIEKK